MDNKEFNFTLTIDEVNAVLGGLAELPFKVSNTVVQKIVQQYQAQIEQPKAVEASE